MLLVGDPVPDFTLPLSLADGSREPVAFSSLLGEGPVVVTFYPIAFSGVCTPHVCEVNAHLAALKRLGASRVVAFSTDAPQVNAAFAKLNQLDIGIFSDPNRDVVDEMWATTTTGQVARTAVRGWMVVDAAGKVVATHQENTPDDWSGVKPLEEALAKARA